MDEQKITVLQPYSLTMAKHKFTAVEMRIMAHILLKLKNEQLNQFDSDVTDSSDLFNKFKTIKIRSADTVVSDNHRHVKKALKSLRARDVELKGQLSNGKDGTIYTGLIVKSKYSDDGSSIDIEVDGDLLPKLIELGKNYTNHGLEFLFKTSSAHAIRWYQIGSHWLKKGVFYISKDELRRIFSVENKYKAHKDFKHHIVTNPIKKVNEKSDINIILKDTHKEGRRVVGFTFEVVKKLAEQSKTPDTDANTNRDQNTSDKDKFVPFSFKSEKQRKWLARQLAELPQLGDRAKGFDAKRSYDAFALQIANELLIEEHQKFYKPYLAIVGFEF